MGWNLTAERTPVFANARYLLHHADWQTFQDPEIKAQVEARLQFEYIDDTLTPLRTLGILDLLDGERALTPEVTAIPTPGHTPGHMSPANLLRRREGPDHRRRVRPSRLDY